MRRCASVSVLGAVLVLAGCSAALAPAGTAEPPPTGAVPSGGVTSSSGTPVNPLAPLSEHELRKLPQAVGQITAENGDSWTVHDSTGPTYTVTITPRTVFGSRVHPAGREQFPVGAHARIRGNLSGSTMTAVQVRLPSAKHPEPTG